MTSLPLSQGLSHPAPPAASDAVLLQEVDIAQPIPCVIFMNMRTGLRYRRGLLLVRLFSRPIGFVELATDNFQIAPEEIARQIWAKLAQQINTALREEGLQAIESLDAFGLRAAVVPRSVREREALKTNAPAISVIVCTRDRPDAVMTCLRSLQRLDYPEYEVIVVDTPSDSRTHDLVTQQFPAVRYVREDRPGISHARNTGLAHATGEIVAFTDDDAVVDRHWLLDLLRGFRASYNVGCVTGLTLPIELETPAQVLYAQQYNSDKHFTERVFDLRDNRSGNPLYPFHVLALGGGVNMAFKTHALRTIGGFDPALGIGSAAHGGEDLAANYEMLRRGYQFAYQPGAIVQHAHRDTYANLRDKLYGDSAGFSAHLTRMTLHDRRHMPGVAVTLLRAALPALLPRIARGERLEYPLELRLAALRGLLHGPRAYLRTRR